VKQKIKLAVAKIVALHAEFSAAEISEAYEFIRTKGIDSSLGIKLSGVQGGVSFSAVKRANKERMARPSFVENVLAYVANDRPERLRVLDELEAKLRLGELDYSLEEIRKIVLSLDKSAVLGRSKRDAVPKLIDLLAHASDEKFREALVEVYERRPRSEDGDEGYINLAKYILRGEG